ncbi:YutD family protein [Paenibacillus chungangensis]|uniref:YutD-like domain-containing protein n=1 Tax=Paenibacillus chungangensis TaxID=696535 RepID=A0ABW3HUH3_9BACL
MALIHIGGKSYELVHENRDGWNAEAFRNRYSEVLEKYDYIIGDWGYNQLRLKGFFQDGNGKATKDSTFSYASDYINEYCNFGCAYFVLEKKSGGRIEPGDENLDLLEEPVRHSGAASREAVVDVKAQSGGQTVAQSGAQQAQATSTPAGKRSGEQPGDEAPPTRDNHGGGRRQRQRSDGQEKRQEGQARRRDNRRGGKYHDQKNKKSVKTAANEAAATSENGRNKNSGRS